MTKDHGVLILYISDFGGHSKAAENIKEAFLYRNSQMRILSMNGFGYFYPRGEKFVDFIYTFIIKHVPELWGRAYDRKKVIKTLTPFRKLVNKFSFGKLNKLMEKFEPTCFVATQAFPCGVFADYKEKFGINIPLIAIVTDYYPHRFWIHPFIDKYVVACQEAKDILIHEGVEEEKIKILGIPISAKFLTSYPRKNVAADLGFSNKLTSVLIMGGGLGMGPIEDIALQLDGIDKDLQIIVVCGKNKELYNWFDNNKKRFRKPLFYFGYIDFVNKIMDFSDIIITKGGGITVSEALAKGLAIIIANPIPGQEERNVKHLLRKNVVLEADRISCVKDLVCRLLADRKELYLLKEKAKENSYIDSSLRIVDLILGEMIK